MQTFSQTLAEQPTLIPGYLAKKKELLICSLNAPSLLKLKAEIEMLLRDNNIDILALNETKIDHIVNDSLFSIDGYNHERCDRNRHDGGVLIYIKDTITYDRLDISKSEADSLETVTIQIKPKCAKPLVKRKSYFSRKLEENRGNIKETWKVLNTAIRRKSKTTTINSLDVNSKTFTDPKDIAQELNHHFSTTADKIASEAKKNNENTMGNKEASYYCHSSPNNRGHLNFN